MKIIVKRFCLSHNGGIYTAGDVVEIEDPKTAKRLVARSGGDLEIYHGDDLADVEGVADENADIDNEDGGTSDNIDKEQDSRYIYFGKLFGGLVIEFVYFNTNNSDNNNEQERLLPLALNKVFYGHVSVFSRDHPTLPTTIAGLTPDKGRIRVKFSVGKEKSFPVYGIIIGTI